MAVRIECKASVAKDLQKFDRASATRVLAKIEKTLASGAMGAQALSGDFAGLYRLRVGDYRVIYARTDESYLVLRIGHRSDVYRKGRP